MVNIEVESLGLTLISDLQKLVSNMLFPIAKLVKCLSTIFSNTLNFVAIFRPYTRAFFFPYLLFSQYFDFIPNT